MANTTQGVPFLDLSRENLPLEGDIQAAMRDVCRAGAFVLGPACERLEQELAARAGVRHGIGCASGSDALLLALMALDIQPGDEVIVPSFTFFATGSAVTRLGAQPVFVDIDPRTYNMDIDRFREAITPRTRAVVPVHLFGQSADMAALMPIAREHGLMVVEDAAQAIGAKQHGRAVGSWGDIGCLSFYPTKNLGGFGDGGMMLTDNDELAERLRLLRAHGMKPRYVHREVGINSRLDGLQAAVLQCKLPHLDEWTEARRGNAAYYAEHLRDGTLSSYFDLPHCQDGMFSVWNQFTIRVRHGLRDTLRQYLKDQGIGTEVYYPIPVHQQICYQADGFDKIRLPQTERAAAEVLSLPVFPQLARHELDLVIEQTLRFFRSEAARESEYRRAAA
jgi:dTDP-4-amino-4,6-dideoxygalactose transaminase